jgi:hypothetical protein
VVSSKTGDASAQPPQAKQLPGRRSRKILLLPLFLALLLIVGIGASYWGFLVPGKHQGDTPAAGQATVTPQPSAPAPTVHPTVAAAATLATSYAGTIVDLQANVPSGMKLTHTLLNDGHISGSIDALQMRGTFSGILDASKHLIYFIETASSGHASLSFTGTVKADGELGGSFCAIDQYGQCIPNGVFGLWSVAPQK